MARVWSLVWCAGCALSFCVALHGRKFLEGGGRRWNACVRVLWETRLGSMVDGWNVCGSRQMPPNAQPSLTRANTACGKHRTQHSGRASLAAAAPATARCGAVE